MSEGGGGEKEKATGPGFLLLFMQVKKPGCVEEGHERRGERCM